VGGKEQEGMGWRVKEKRGGSAGSRTAEKRLDRPRTATERVFWGVVQHGLGVEGSGRERFWGRERFFEGFPRSA